MPRAIASGADELLIAMQTPSPSGQTGLPTLLWGAPGEGKTTFVEGLNGPGFPVETMIASIHDPTDFSGLPVHENGRMRFAPPEWASVFDDAQQGILFLDELTTAPPSVQAALLRVVLERRVGTQVLPSGVRIVAAANPPDDIVGGWELSPPLANRFVHIEWRLTGTVLADAFQDGFVKAELPTISANDHRGAVPYWRLLTASFLRRDPSLVQTRPAEGERGFASPRTWDYAIQLMASCQLLKKAPVAGGRGSSIFFNLLRGTVGSAAAKTFVHFIKELRLPDPRKVLDAKESVDVESLNDDELYVLFGSLAGELSRRKATESSQDSSKSKQAKEGFLDGTMITLSLVDQVNQQGRIDAVFAPVRQLARGQIFQHAANAARKGQRVHEFQGLINRVFNGTPLADYVSCFEGGRNEHSQS